VWLAASVVVLAGKFAFDSNAARYGGLAVLVAASIGSAILWNGQVTLGFLYLVKAQEDCVCLLR
jgi:hypothetical protein